MKTVLRLCAVLLALGTAGLFAESVTQPVTAVRPTGSHAGQVAWKSTKKHKHHKVVHRKQPDPK